jgi:hypothetical protein
MHPNAIMIGEDEILGGETLVGYDYAELLGADASPEEVHQVAMARQAGGHVIARKAPSTMRVQSLPFKQDYTASQTANVQLTPQRLFRPERLTFASLTAIYFQINSVSIAQEPQFVAEGQALAQLYTEVAVGMRLKGKTANLGAQIVIAATNLDTLNSRTLWGQFVGPAAL